MRTELLKLLSEQLPREPKLAVLAGHYALFQDDEKTHLVPGIYQDMPDGLLQTELRRNLYAGVFSEETLYFGRELVETQSSGQILCLVNDWRWTARHTTARLNYFRTSSVPDSFLWALSKLAPLNTIMVPVPERLRVEGNAFLWSEQVLQESFSSHGFASCSLEHGCAQEFVPLLMSLQDTGYTDFVALIPSTCKDPTVDGVREAIKKLGLRMNVYTLYVYNTLEAKNFWEGVEVYKNGEMVFP